MRKCSVHLIIREATKITLHLSLAINQNMEREPLCTAGGNAPVSTAALCTVAKCPWTDDKSHTETHTV